MHVNVPFQLIHVNTVAITTYLCPCAVEEVVDYSSQLDASVGCLPTTSGVARTDLQNRPPIAFPSPASTPYSTQNSVHPATLTARPPLPPPKPKRPPELDQPEYIQPEVDSVDGIKDSMYFLLSATGEKIMEDGPQGPYEEMEYDRQELNRNPPPLWKPPPQPSRNPSSSSTSSIIYSRVEGGKIVDHTFTGNLSGAAHVGPHNTMREISEQPKPIPKPKTGKKDGARLKHSKPNPPPKQVGAPAPPTRPKQAPHWGQEKNLLKNILNDPNLVGKLHEKRQELYGAVDAPRASVSSCGSDNPMENYEEVCFDLVNTVGSDEENASSAFSRVTNMTLPPRRHNIGSEIAMLQCPPEEPKAQEYISFQPSPSHSPRESTTDLANSDSHTSMHSLSPLQQRKVTETQPELPPRDTERIHGGSPRLVRKPISAAANHQTRPPAPHARSRKPLKQRSISQEELQKNQSSKPRSLLPRPASSSFEEPPPVPLRSTSTKDESLPQPNKRRDLSVPLPLPSDTSSNPPKPPNFNFPNVKYSLDEDSSPPPPVPTRQTSANPNTIQLQQASLSDDAPPVPSRGHRQSDVRFTPSLQKTDMPTDVQAHVTRKTPIRSPRELSFQPHTTTLDASTDAPSRPDVRVPRTKPMPPPPVTSKPATFSTKPNKPPVSAKPPSIAKPNKPPVSARPIGARVQPRGEIPPQTATQRPLHNPRPVPANHRNGEFAPPLPPR